MLSNITPLILTFNEAPNIARTLSKLGWASDVVIVDSMSTDRTREVATSAHPGVRWFERPFTTHAEQWNFGLTSTGIKTDWVLALDADFVLTDQLVEELQSLSPDSAHGYIASFVYCINGHPLRGTVYPPVTVLYRRDSAHYVDDGHTQRVRVNGQVRPLLHGIRHDDRKPLAHWLASQSRYMRIEAEKLERTPSASLSLIDRVRKMIVVAPAAMFLYCLIGKGGILDGTAGLYYALQRATAELILSLNLIDRMINRHGR
jgi:glycosyltransferase involved in cell wall biosynthesis